MGIFNVILRYFNPLKYGIKNGMKVGKGVSLAGKSGVSFGSEPYLIELGDEVRISGNVKFFTHDGATWAYRDLEDYKDVSKFGAIKVGKRTFIGNSVCILPGVTIGERCIIGAGSVVTRDVESGMVVAGNPAKVLCTTNEYMDKCKERWNDFHGLSFDIYKTEKRRYLEERFLK